MSLPADGHLARAHGHGELADPLALGDHVAGPAAQDGVVDPGDVGHLGPAQREAQLDGRRLALGPAGGVGAPGQLAAHARVHHRELDVLGQANVLDRSVREVDQQGVPGPALGAHQRVHETDVGPHDGLGPLAEQGHHLAQGLDLERLGQRHADRGARGEAGAHRQGAGDPPDPAAGRAGLGRHGRRQPGPAGLDVADVVAVEGDVDRQVGRHGIDGRVEQEPLGVVLGEVHLGGQVDGHGEGHALVVVGVVADQVHPARCPPDQDAVGRLVVGVGTLLGRALHGATTSRSPERSPVMMAR